MTYSGENVCVVLLRVYIVDMRTILQVTYSYIITLTLTSINKRNYPVDIHRTRFC